jgi:TonB family protein
MTVWLSNLAAYSIQLAVLVATAAVVTSLMHLRRPRTAVAFWQALLVAALLLPLLQPWTGTTSDRIVSTLSFRTASGATPADTDNVSVARWLVIALATGVVMRLAWLGLGLFRLRQISSRAVRADQRSTLFADLTADLEADAELRVTDEVDGPATVGARPAVVLLPARALALPVAVQRAILCHELIHVRRRDWLYTLSEEFLCAVLWFHPAARVLVSRISLAREMLVDQATIAHTGNRRAYAEALLAFSNPQPRLVAATPLIRRRHHAQRVALITEEVPMSRRRAALIVVMTTLAVGVATTATIAQFPIATAVSAQSRPEVFKAGDGVSLPRVLTEVKPQYTKEAMNAKIQGTVAVRTLVLASGEVGDVEVVRSLDDKYGLDRNAVAAAKQWTFAPGKKDGKPVAVEVTIEMAFTLKD